VAIQAYLLRQVTLEDQSKALVNAERRNLPLQISTQRGILDTREKVI
jgi:hypothetical protein